MFANQSVALAEWLRRVPAKYMGFSCESLNLSDYGIANTMAVPLDFGDGAKKKKPKPVLSNGEFTAYKGALAPVNSSFHVKFSSGDCRCGAITGLRGQPTTISLYQDKGQRLILHG
ncbi:hypothetical protein V6N13_108108 [Hibiscus sabdariffa]